MSLRPQQRGDEEERLGTGAPPGYAHPVNIDMLYRFFLDHVESPKIVVPRRGVTLEAEDLQIIEELATSIKRSFVSRGSLVVSVASKTAFAEDVKRKFEIVYMIAEEMVDALKAEVMRNLEAYVEAARSGRVDDARRLATEVDRSLRKLLLLPLAVLKVIDELAGVLQLNLPLDIMSNMVKAHLGVVTT